MTPEEFDDWLNQSGSLTPEEAQKAYDETVPIPLSEERIQEIVDYAVSSVGSPLSLEEFIARRERIKRLSAWIDCLMVEPDERQVITEVSLGKPITVTYS